MKLDFTQYRKNQMVDNKYVVVCPTCRKKALRAISPTENGQSVTTYIHQGLKEPGYAVEPTVVCQVVSEVTAKTN
jgi:hypothetical protein